MMGTPACPRVTPPRCRPRLYPSPREGNSLSCFSQVPALAELVLVATRFGGKVPFSPFFPPPIQPHCPRFPRGGCDAGAPQGDGCSLGAGRRRRRLTRGTQTCHSSVRTRSGFGDIPLPRSCHHREYLHRGRGLLPPPELVPSHLPQPILACNIWGDALRPCQAPCPRTTAAGAASCPSLCLSIRPSVPLRLSRVWPGWPERGGPSAVIKAR